MDTKPREYVDFKRLYNASRCGQWVTEFRPVSGSSSTAWVCKTWDCEKCVRLKIDMFKETLDQNINGPHVFISHIENRNFRYEGKAGRESSNWITRHRPRVPNFFYLSIWTPYDVLLVSSHGFVDLPFIRISKRRYIDKDLPAFLLEHHGDVIDFSHSSILSNRTSRPRGERNSANPVLMRFSNDHNNNLEHYKVSDELDNLKHKTEREIAEGLVEKSHKPGYRLTPDGEVFIQRHLGNQD